MRAIGRFEHRDLLRAELDLGGGNGIDASYASMVTYLAPIFGVLLGVVWYLGLCVTASTTSQSEG